MSKSNREITNTRKYGSIFVSIFCAVVTICTVLVLLFGYKPDMNALGALGSVCMDVISMFVIIILVMNLTFEKIAMNKTYKLFLSLMLVTLWALFFDFLNWAYDGALSFDNWTYLFTVASLCSGAILACLFSMYLGSYIKDMYEIKGAIFSVRFCVICNLVAFALTLTLALTRTAFDFVDGHYRLGALYDGVTAIPIITLIYMTGYTIRHVKTIGMHDIIAVVGYILIMITGALVEAVYGIGATYVSVSIADILIFLMLQNNIIDRVRKQREALTEEITSQYEILGSMADIYSYVNEVDLKEKIAKRFDKKDSEIEQLDISSNSHTNLNKRLYDGIEENQKEKFWTFTDLSTLSSRMIGEKIISAEFCHREDGWLRAQYIRIGDSLLEPISKVIYAIQNIDEEKKNVEKWIIKSNTDELTGFYNRHAYEDDIIALEEGRIKDNFVYVSMDVNSLKIANDTLGHEAGDELIIGASECMRQCFGAYGKIYRTGGDEFAALIFADEITLEEIKKDINELSINWKGKLVESPTISCGYVSYREAKDMSIHQMAVLADKRMYEDKAKYYQKKGIDRRGQREAHVALCELYTKILKINVTDDSYQIINIDLEERSREKGFSDTLSQWMKDFAAARQVHEDNLEEYYKKVNPEYISDYFKNGNKSLRMIYRRMIRNEYNQVVLEIIPANDYSDEVQNLFLYVKNIE